MDIEQKLEAFNLHFIDKLTIKATAELLGVPPLEVLTELGLKKPFNLQKHMDRLRAKKYLKKKKKNRRGKRKNFPV